MQNLMCTQKVTDSHICVARGALGVCAHPGWRKYIWGPNLQWKVVSAPPGRACVHRQSKSPFLRQLGRS